MILPRNDESVLEDIDGWAGRSVGDKDAALRALLRLTDALVDQSPHRDRIRAWQDPRSPQALEDWRRLIARGRGA